ncbi:MAG: hypothetical protein GY710_01865 [Desulfobacteraceae bacterium]|nr:hypothetical protein [Desulfobacteraceae bacterium]
MIEFIDVETWARKEHFRFFATGEGAVRFSLTQPLNVTNLVLFCEKHQLSFYYSLIFVVTQTANGMAGFRQRLQNGQPVEYDQVHPLFTDLSSGDELFKLVMGKMHNELPVFVGKTKTQVDQQQCYLPVNEFMNRDDILNITCYPWGNFSSMQVKPVTADVKDNAVPFIAWGQYQQEGDQFILSFYMEVSHCFLDALHIYRYKMALESAINVL